MQNSRFLRFFFEGGAFLRLFGGTAVLYSPYFFFQDMRIGGGSAPTTRAPVCRRAVEPSSRRAVEPSSRRAVEPSRRGGVAVPRARRYARGDASPIYAERRSVGAVRPAETTPKRPETGRKIAVTNRPTDRQTERPRNRPKQAETTPAKPSSRRPIEAGRQYNARNALSISNLRPSWGDCRRFWGDFGAILPRPQRLKYQQLASLSNLFWGDCLHFREVWPKTEKPTRKNADF